MADNQYQTSMSSEEQIARSHEFSSHLKDKRVCIVCPSKTLVGSGLGAKIDDFDIVVRLNQGYDYSHNQASDFGSRTDLLYHFLSLKNEFRYGFDLEKIGRCGTKFLVIPPRPETANFQYFLEQNEDVRLPFLVFDEQTIQRVRENVPGLPFLGVLAVVHLLQRPIESLKVLGMNFYHTGHFQNYDKRSEAEQISYARNSQFDARGISKRHFIEPQKEFLRRLLATEERLSGDISLAKALEHKLGGDSNERDPRV